MSRRYLRVWLGLGAGLGEKWGQSRCRVKTSHQVAAIEKIVRNLSIYGSNPLQVNLAGHVKV